jgi:hypothetical protein
MPTVTDFRYTALNFAAITACGRYQGRRSYWRLYHIENTLRIVVHSILTVQISSGWWATAVDPGTQAKATRYHGSYKGRSWFGHVGNHGIYHIDLSDLAKIIRVNSHEFRPIVPDIDDWILDLELVRRPRNQVAHMNLADAADQQAIDRLYRKCPKLVSQVQARVPLAIPS